MKQALMDKLPHDIINLIISYTYNIQSKELLEDIKSYCFTKTMLYNIAIAKYTRYDWFASTKYSIYNITLELQEYIENNKLKNPNKIFLYSYKLNGPPETRINFYWGLLTPEERKGFFINKLISV